MKSYFRIAYVISVLLVMWVLMGCTSDIGRRGRGLSSDFGPSDPNTTGNPNTSTESTDPVLTPDSNGTIGMRNFRQFSGALSAVTGVPTTTAAVITQLNNTQSSLSVDGDATKVSSASLLKSMELAAVYCLQAANTANIRGQVYGNFDFAALPANIADSALSALAQSILNAFIPDSSVDPAVSEKIQIVVDLMKAIRQGAANNATTRTNMVVGGCTSVAASQGFIFLN